MTAQRQPSPYRCFIIDRTASDETKPNSGPLCVFPHHRERKSFTRQRITDIFAALGDRFIESTGQFRSIFYLLVETLQSTLFEVILAKHRLRTLIHQHHWATSTPRTIHGICNTWARDGPPGQPSTEYVFKRQTWADNEYLSYAAAE